MDKPATANQVATATVVLDTNVVIDWLLFGDPSCALLSEHIASGRLRWIASSAMQAELDHVVARSVFDAKRVNEPALRAGWDRRCTLIEPTPLSGPALRLRCTDPDDQMFIDLALANRVPWLLSRDRAVLKLARRAAVFGTKILTPVAWTAQATPAAE